MNRLQEASSDIVDMNVWILGPEIWLVSLDIFAKQAF